MKNKGFVLPEREGLPAVTEQILEPFLAALRNRDGEGLAQLTAQAALAAREARAALISRGVKRDGPSHALGTLETMESLTERAAQRHGRNAQFEAARRRGASALLIAVGRSSGGIATHKQLTGRLPDIQPSNISRLTRELRNAGLLMDAQEVAPAEGTDARVRPMSLTPAAHTLLDQTHPDWSETALEEEEDEVEVAGEDAAAEAARLDSRLLESFERIMPQLVERLRTELARKDEADLPRPDSNTTLIYAVKSQTSLKVATPPQELSVQRSLAAAASELSMTQVKGVPSRKRLPGLVGVSAIGPGSRGVGREFSWDEEPAGQVKGASGAPVFPSPMLVDRTRRT
jgi:hypothetical protein